VSDETPEEYQEIAKSMRELYVALLLEGFNEAQAEHITGKAMEGAMQR